MRKRSKRNVKEVKEVKRKILKGLEILENSLSLFFCAGIPKSSDLNDNSMRFERYLCLI